MALLTPISKARRPRRVLRTTREVCEMVRFVRVRGGYELVVKARDNATGDVRKHSKVFKDLSAAVAAAAGGSQPDATFDFSVLTGVKP